MARPPKRSRPIRRSTKTASANNLVQSDDPQIVALAKQAAGDKTDAWEVAQALERFVCDYIQDEKLFAGLLHRR